MTTPADTARRAILGIPYDPGKKPERHLLVQAFEEQSIVANAVNTGSIVKDTKANLDLVTAAPEDQMAWVVGDATPANNGIYENTGTASVTVWTRRADIPQGVIPMTDVGAGTANAIVTTTPLAVPATLKALFILFPFEANTGAVTLANNGAAAKPLKDVAGADLLPGALSATQPVLLAEEATVWRMLNDYASAANQELARLWANDDEDSEPDPIDHAGEYSARHWRNKAEDQAIYSEEWAQSGALISVPAGGNGTTDRSSKWHADRSDAAAIVASGAMSAIVIAENTFSTISTAEAWAPAAAPDYIRTAGYATAGDGGGALYRKVLSEPSHDGKFSITLDDAVTVVWFEIAENTPNAFMFGAVADGATDDTVALQALFDCGASVVEIPAGVSSYRCSNLVVPTTIGVIFSGAILERNSSTSGPIIEFSGSNVISGSVEIDGVKASYTGTGRHGVRLGADSIWLARASIHDCYAHGMQLSEADNTVVRHVTSYDNGTNPGSSGTGDGIYVINSDNAHVCDCIAFDNSRMGITVTTYNAGTLALDKTLSTGCRVTECEAYGNQYIDFDLEGISDVYASKCGPGSVAASSSEGGLFSDLRVKSFSAIVHHNIKVRSVHCKPLGVVANVFRITGNAVDIDGVRLYDTASDYGTSNTFEVDSTVASGFDADASVRNVLVEKGYNALVVNGCAYLSGCGAENGLNRSLSVDGRRITGSLNKQLSVVVLGGVLTARFLLSGDPSGNGFTGTPLAGDAVYQSTPAEAGSSPNKYVTIGYIHTGSAWLPMRALTGN